MKEKELSLKCNGCGGLLKFKPGTNHLRCPYCQYDQSIESSAEVEELDYSEQLIQLKDKEEQIEESFLKCGACGATVTMEAGVTSEECPYCSTSLMNVDAGTMKSVKPGALIPFIVEKSSARERFRKWIGSLWFAPSDLKKRAGAGKVNGVYIPYWTFDSDTSNQYSGSRGDYYYTTETYTTTNSEGETEVRQRQVRHTRWSPAAGHVSLSFDDLMISGGTTLPEKYVNKLTPWHLNDMVVFDERYLSGFRSEACSKGLEESFENARSIMKLHIEDAVKRDIGGDLQVINSLNSDFRNTKFRHLLVPVWISSYRYRDKVYRFLINGQTGEVQGERPWSVSKILLTIFITIGIIAGTIFFLQ